MWTTNSISKSIIFWPLITQTQIHNNRNHSQLWVIEIRQTCILTMSVLLRRSICHDIRKQMQLTKIAMMVFKSQCKNFLKGSRIWKGLCFKVQIGSQNSIQLIRLLMKVKSNLIRKHRLTLLNYLDLLPTNQVRCH